MAAGNPQGQDATFNQGRIPVTFSGSIARTDTSAKNLFVLPANFFPTNILVASPAPSNAGTTATISVGKSGGSGTEFLNALDVKTAGTGGGSQKPSASASTLFGQSIGTAPVTVTGIYAETGGASNAGGPWEILVEGFVV